MKKYQKPTLKTVSLEYEAVICLSGNITDTGYDTQYAKRQDSFWNTTQTKQFGTFDDNWEDVDIDWD